MKNENRKSYSLKRNNIKRRASLEKLHGTGMINIEYDANNRNKSIPYGSFGRLLLKIKKNLYVITTFCLMIFVYYIYLFVIFIIYN